IFAKAKIKSALLYPVVVMIASVVSLGILFGFVVPRFRPFFEDVHAPLPFVTRAVLEAGDLFQSYWWLPPLALAASVIYLVGMVRDPRRRQRWDAVMLKLPFFGALSVKI